MFIRNVWGADEMSGVADERRRQILEAAAACFTRKGFHQASMADICAEAKLSPGSVYRYFRSKDDLIVAMVEEDRRETEQLVGSVRGRPDLVEALRELAGTVLSPAEAERRNDPLAVEIAAEALRNDRVRECVRRYDEGVVAELAAALREGQAAGAVDPSLDPAAAGRLLFALVDGLTTWAMLHPETDPAATRAAVGTMIERFLRPRDASAKRR